MFLSAEARSGLLNLHDAFLNASLMRAHMEASHFDSDPLLFHATDRGRFERLWVALLAVLVESWNSEQMMPTRDFIAAVTSVDALVGALRQARKDGNVDKMVAVRHYMFHRDKREYWDEGRSAPWGQLTFHRDLHELFGSVLLETMRATGRLNCPSREAAC